MDLMTPSGGTIFWTTVVFIFLLLILRKVAWKPILQILEEREKQIKESLVTAEKAKTEAQKTLAQQGEILDQARREAQEIIAKSRKAAEITKDEIVQKAEAEANNLLVKAKREIELSRDKALEDIQNLAVELSMSATKKLIGQTLKEKDHQILIQDTLKKMGEIN